MIDTFIYLLMHPVVLFLGQILLTAFAIGFTRSSSTLRFFILPLQALALWIIYERCLKVIPDMSIVSFVAGNASIYFLRYIDVALLSRWTFKADGPTTSLCPRTTKLKTRDGDEVHRSNSPPTSESHITRLVFGFNTTISTRHVGTPYEVKNTPQFSSDTGVIPPRGEFIRDSLVKIIICYFVVDAITLKGPPENASVLIGPDKIPVFFRLAEVTGRDIILRIFSTLLFWLTMFCWLRLTYGVAAFVTVLLGWYDARDWRPPFGSVSEAWSVRQLWG